MLLLEDIATKMIWEYPLNTGNRDDGGAGLIDQRIKSSTKGVWHQDDVEFNQHSGVEYSVGTEVPFSWRDDLDNVGWVRFVRIVTLPWPYLPVLRAMSFGDQGVGFTPPSSKLECTPTWHIYLATSTHGKCKSIMQWHSNHESLRSQKVVLNLEKIVCPK